MPSNLMSNQPQRHSCEEVQNLLWEREALVVHFSTCPPMHADPTGHYPDDLRHALGDQHCINTGVSCSVVTPQDPFSGENRFTPGYVGIILKPANSQSIISCCVEDDGDCRNLLTGMVNSEMEDSDMSIEYLCKTIDNRQSYNNWLVRDYQALGILALSPYAVPVIINHPLLGEERIISNKNLTLIAHDFPDQRMFTIEHQRYLEFQGDTLAEVAYRNIWN